MTRTVVVGEAIERQREIHSAVLAANLAAIAAATGGIPGSSLDEVARTVLKDRGLAEYFVHGLGHGVGLAVHEQPVVGPRGTKSIPASSVITIEPGVYMPGFGGVRIEDLVVVEESGARVLSRSSKDLIEL
jgi:Xaa-Pro aminopeptidase